MKPLFVLFFALMLSTVSLLHSMSCPHCLSQIKDNSIRCTECYKWIDKEIRYVQKSVSRKIDFIVTTSTSKFDKVIFNMTVNGTAVGTKIDLLNVNEIKLNLGRHLFEYHFRTEDAYEFKAGTRISIEGRILYKNRYRKFAIKRHFASMKTERAYLDLANETYQIKATISGWEPQPYQDFQVYSEKTGIRYKYEFPPEE